MHRTISTTLLALTAVAGLSTTAMAGSLNGYTNGGMAQPPMVTTYSAPPPPPVMQTYTAPLPAAPAEPIKDGYYDESLGGNAEFGYQQQHACGGATTGEKCLVILSDHMRRVRLDGPAGTILVGNPLIADVTVLGNDTIFVSARTIGSTNIIVLDKNGNEMVTYEVFVREPRIKRVVLNNAGVSQNYQCAPHCERALTQSDSPAPYEARAGIISTDLGLDTTAIGLQSGPNPNAQQQPEADASTYQPGPSSAAPAAPGGALAASVNGLGASLGPAIGLAGTVSGMLGGGAASASGPARTDAPPLPVNQGSF